MTSPPIVPSTSGLTRPDRPGPDDAIVVDGLHRRFGDVTAVDGLSFRMATGSILSLLGPNGAGKTTTVEICEGFTRADAGQVRVLGLDPWRQSAALRPRIGVMLQAGGAHASARAGEMLDLVANCSANPLDPAALLDLLGLTPSARTPVRRLSGGQVQRLSLAMALVGRPELLFLDEPTAGLDPQARHLVWDLLRAARADGVSILLTTHLLDEAELLSDRIVIVDNGRCVAAGTPAELTGGGAQLRFTASPGLELDVLRSALPLGFTVAETAPGRYLLEGDIAPSTMATVTSFCARVGVMPSAMQVGSRSLDEVYLELTGKELRS
ncbi:ABC-2 type transport system ATP-binding protein [Nakamurella panacisegetis]|uniref:ABC-2 type transport system ATP-binding protein n=1 Tax=Nakamurella panacisegetis TaxID=1090615 RepID=A0A1H0SGP7_9ACTN|nr:ABC transporter ATP-binding protein [Nakamurella panacisegetis]SDP40867.1 ABC-2 type transport system ATP-binding protein [Nakamurella panacisegetis]